jgi:hypothetical protein
MGAKIEAGIRRFEACELFIIARELNVPMEQFHPAGLGSIPC